MKTFVCLLVVLGVASAQQEATTTGGAEVNTVADTGTTDVVNDIVSEVTAGGAASPSLAAEQVPAAASPAAEAAPAPATNGNAAAAAAGGLANRQQVRQGTVGLGLGAAFYGPGAENPTAIPPNPITVGIIQNYLKTAPNAANLRVFVDVDGALHFTNQFGQETEVLDPTVNEFLEISQDPFEMQERLTELRQINLEQSIQRCQSELTLRYGRDPSQFTPALLRGVNIPTVGLGGTGVGARAVVA